MRLTAITLGDSEIPLRVPLRQDVMGRGMLISWGSLSNRDGAAGESWGEEPLLKRITF
jgi:hypothetical protein